MNMGRAHVALLFFCIYAVCESRAKVCAMCYVLCYVLCAMCMCHVLCAVCTYVLRSIAVYVLCVMRFVLGVGATCFV